MPPDLQHFALGDFPLGSGAVLGDARLGWRSFGRLSPGRDNAVLLPSYYTGTSSSYDAMIGPGRALDPERWFIVTTDMFGNGRSTSPSHAATPAGRAAFPAVTIADNVAAQARLADHLGIDRWALVHGWSMGALQAWEWATSRPGRVAAILPVCGASRCWPQNRAFLEGVRAALTADPAWAGGAYDTPPEAGIRAFGRAYCGWAFSPRFFRDALYCRQGHDSLEALLVDWEEDHLAHDAADLLSVLDSWATADIGGPDGDWQAALARVTARVIAMPCDQDRYFIPEENALEVERVPGAELRPLVSPYGHCAGAPGRWPDETARIEAAIAELLAG